MFFNSNNRRRAAILAATAVSLTTVALPAPAFADDTNSHKTTLSSEYSESRSKMVVEFTPIDEKARAKLVDDGEHKPLELDGRVASNPSDTQSADQSLTALSPHDAIPGYTPPKGKKRHRAVSPAHPSTDIVEYQDSQGLLLPPDEAGVMEQLLGDNIVGYSSSASSLSSINELDIPYNATAAQKAIAYAKTKLGTAYLWGGTGPDRFDCSGLMQWAYRQAGVSLNRVTYDQINDGQRVSLANIKPGDLVFYNNTSHVAMYVGNGQVIHAPQDNDVVKISPVQMMPVQAVVRVSQ